MNDKDEIDSGFLDMECVCNVINCWGEPDSGEGNEAKPAAPDEVAFDNDYYIVFNRQWMAFDATYQGRVLFCAIPWQLLTSRFGVGIHNHKEAEAVFLSNRPKIEEWAKTLILADRINGENRVMIE